MSSREVLTIIASLNGGFNGEVFGKQIGVEIISDTEAVYTLTVWENDQPTDQVERYTLTLAELPPLPPEEPEWPTPPEEGPQGEAVIAEPAPDTNGA